MVFGNKLRSGTGIALSHNALTGTRRLSGEWLSEAQDELVSGERTPLPLSQLKELHPDAYKQLNTFVSRTHKMVGEPLEFEFTVESDKLHLLQARAQKLAPESAIKRVVQDVKAGKITQADALAKITPTQVEAVRLARFRPSALRDAEPLASGLPASPGAAVGRVVHSSQEALTATRRGESVILVRPTTDPSDLDGMLAAKALITKNGGTTSHAAIVALEQGKPCITGCEGLANLKGIVSVDGFTGKAYTGALPLEKLQHNPEVETFLRWVNEEEAKKWPAPRLIESTGRHEELAPEAANFYLSERMAHALKTTPLGAEADKLKVDMNVAMAEKMAGMMVDGIETELRAFNVTNLRYTPQLQSDFDTLTNEFGVSLNWSTQEHKNVMEGLIKSSVEDQRRFLGAAENLFSRAEWGNGYEYIDDRYHVFGGSSWGRIASAAQRFLSGDLSHSLFVDHAMDLYHNKGNFFESVIRVLNAQRDALTLDGLYGELSHLDIDPKVRSLYERGSQLKVW
jgi:phosphoenolpyruvate synthase/pyruvate phosphate dikinase